MKMSLRWVVINSAILGVLLGAPTLSNAEDKRASPHEKVTATLGTTKITIEYGRPFKKGRDIFGGLVPWNKVWRTGADQATTFTTDGDVTIGNLRVPKGSYALFTVPGAQQWDLIVNKNPQQWGAFKYDPKDDLGKTTLKVSALDAPVEQLTIALDTVGNKANLKISWDKTAATVAVTP